MSAVSIDMGFKLDAKFCKSALEIERILDRNHIVVPCCKEEAGAGVAINVIHRCDDLRTRLTGLSDIQFHSSISQNGCIGLILRHCGRTGCQMPSGGEADHRNFVCHQVPRIRIGADQLHGLLIVVKRVWPCPMLCYRIPKYKCMESGI